jgi:hypothetical protein
MVVLWLAKMLQIHRSEWISSERCSIRLFVSSWLHSYKEYLNIRIWESFQLSRNVLQHILHHLLYFPADILVNLVSMLRLQKVPDRHIIQNLHLKANSKYAHDYRWTICSKHSFMREKSGNSSKLTVKANFSRIYKSGNMCDTYS